MLRSSVICWHREFMCKEKKCKKKNKNFEVVNIDKKHLHIFWTTWGMWIKFTGKISLLIIQKEAKVGLYPL